MIRSIVRVTLAGLVLQFAVKAYTQNSKALAEIPFAFMAGGREMPPGSYELSVPVGNATVLTVRNAKNGEAVQVPVLTRVSARPDAPVLYFDRDDNKSYLAEVYFPGADGVHLQGAPGKHTHARVALK